MVIIQKAISSFNLIDLSTVDIYRFDGGRDDQLVALGCLEKNLLNPTHHVITVFAYNELMVGPAVILQSKSHVPINTGGEITIIFYQSTSINNKIAYRIRS